MQTTSSLRSAWPSTMADLALEVLDYRTEHMFDDYDPAIGIYKETDIDTICVSMLATAVESDYLKKYTFADGSTLVNADYASRPFRSYTNCNCDREHGHDADNGCPNEDEQ